MIHIANRRIVEKNIPLYLTFRMLLHTLSEVTVVCVLVKLRWPKEKNIYDIIMSFYFLVANFVIRNHYHCHYHHYILFQVLKSLVIMTVAIKRPQDNPGPTIGRF